jgi:aminomethyltransferase
MNTELKKTPLAEEHVALGARMVDFAGWWMPVQYSGVKEEHLSTRSAGGLFDVSHMGEIRVKGPNALKTLEWLTTNHVAKLQSGDAHYTSLPNDQGGLVDDIIIYCLEKDQDYFVCVNASNKDKDFQWMLKNNLGADITDESSQWSQIAVQGPKAAELCKKVLAIDLSQYAAFKVFSVQYKGHKVLVATTGYTGETGCELFIESAGSVDLWKQLVAEGAGLGIVPVGLGARDTLRTEMKYSLYGHEIDDQINPYAAGLGWVIKPDAKDFLGKKEFLAGKEKGLTHKLVGFVPLEKGIPRQGYELYAADAASRAKIGWVTSGTHSPSLDAPVGIAYIKSEFAALGTEFLLDIRGRKVKCRVSPTPFVKK